MGESGRPRAHHDRDVVVIDWPDAVSERLEWDDDGIRDYVEAAVVGRSMPRARLPRFLDVARFEVDGDEAASFLLELRTARLAASQYHPPPTAPLPYSDHDE